MIKRAGRDKHVQTDTPANNEPYTRCIYFMFPPSLRWQNTVSAAQTVDIWALTHSIAAGEACLMNAA